MSTFLKSFAKPFAAAVLMALAPVFSGAAPLLANPELPAEPVALFKLASKKSAKPAPDYLVGTVGVELFVTELSSMKVGEKARMTLPNGVAYEIVLDRIDRHAEGDFSWVGHVDGHQHNMPVVVTLGTEGTYGTIDTPEGRFGIIPGEGHDWLFDASMSTLWYDRPAGTTDAMVPDLPHGLREGRSRLPRHHGDARHADHHRCPVRDGARLRERAWRRRPARARA